MASKDLVNDITPVVAIAPVVVADGTLQVSNAVDTIGYESVTFVIALGTLADVDATWLPVVKEGSSATQNTHTAVADADLIGLETQAGFTFAEDGKCRKIGYKGNKRYVSIEIANVVANTGNAPMSAIVLLGNARNAPTANPPV